MTELLKEDRVDIFDNSTLSKQKLKYRGHEARLFSGKLCFNQTFGGPLSSSPWKTIDLKTVEIYGPSEVLLHEDHLPPKLAYFAKKRYLIMIQEWGTKGMIFWLMFPSAEEWHREILMAKGQAAAANGESHPRNSTKSHDTSLNGQRSTRHVPTPAPPKRNNALSKTLLKEFGTRLAIGVVTTATCSLLGSPIADLTHELFNTPTDVGIELSESQTTSPIASIYPSLKDH